MSATIITTVLVPAAPLFQGAQPYDLVGIDTVKADVGIADGSKDKNLKRWITAASKAAANYCNRVFPVETVQDQFFPRRDPFPQVVIGGERPLQLTRWPIVATPALAGIAPPVAPTLGQIAGGALAGTTCWVRTTYVTAQGETPASLESVLAVAGNFLLQVTSPVADQAGLATGWNVYVGTASGNETKQNSAAIAIGTAWTEPTSGLVAGAAVPNLVTVVENSVPLAEGVDFIVKPKEGQLVRIDTNGWPKRWPALPILAIYPAGYSAVAMPDDLVEAVILLVKKRYYAANRDPMLRQENAVGIYEATYWFGAGPGGTGSTGNLPPEIQQLLNAYRVPVVG